ncbi:hypothetical protein [Vibrio hippocampi]|uniref:Outer membrane protein beta-barrel domain-containing protein n=1 Tax=Vibrio hippocampi TaxID=654686 RepID=A0ABM8ZMC4_9VIBR|nr:hypothetical protein [Vibrio hippocampi]CAH0529609.1 hypothetical protein VHP8226_03364 [Vibrio hippocampi]
MLGKVTRISLLAMTFAVPNLASANNFNYNSFSVRLGASPGTIGAEFSTFFTENTHFIVRGDSRFEGDWDFAGGIGFNGPLGQFADVYGQLMAHSVKGTDNDNYDNEFLTEFNMGTRIWLLPNVEAGGHIGMLNGADDTKFIYSAGARFHSTEALSLGAAIADNGLYGSQLQMSVRFEF